MSKWPWACTRGKGNSTADIHQDKLSSFSVLAQFFVRKVSVKDFESLTFVYPNLCNGIDGKAWTGPF